MTQNDDKLGGKDTNQEFSDTGTQVTHKTGLRVTPQRTYTSSLPPGLTSTSPQKTFSFKRSPTFSIVS